MAQAPPLTVIFRGKTSAPIRRTGNDWEPGSRPGSGQTVQTRSVIGRWHGLVIDCPDPRGLAAFYQELLGMQRVQDDDHWVVIGDAPDRPGLAFQLAPDLEPPQWPDPGHPQQMHLDIAVTDIDQAEKQALGLGARRLPSQGPSFRVYSDPAGHPFCLVTLESSRSIE